MSIESCAEFTDGEVIKSCLESVLRADNRTAWVSLLFMVFMIGMVTLMVYVLTKNL